MFCSKCGNQVSEGTAFCPACGAPVNAQPQAQPKPAATGGLASTIKPYLHFIAVGIAVLALVWGILNVFSVFEVNTTVSAMGQSESTSSSVSDVADGLELMDSSAAAIYIGNILFGLTCLVAAAIGILYFLKGFKNMPLYDQYIGSKLKFGPLFLMGAVGAVGAILQVILYMFNNVSTSMFGVTARMSFGVNWTTWMMLVIFAGIAALDYFVLNKKAQ